MSDVILNSITAIMFSLGTPIKGTEDFKLDKYAAGTQAIKLIDSYEIYQSCKPARLPLMFQLVPPANGTVTFELAEIFPAFEKGHSHFGCNDIRTPGIKAVYSARTGFLGSDSFSFLVVYLNGQARRYTTKVTIWPDIH